MLSSVGGFRGVTRSLMDQLYGGGNVNEAIPVLIGGVLGLYQRLDELKFRSADVFRKLAAAQQTTGCAGAGGQ
jgi:hypothetical protein